MALHCSRTGLALAELDSIDHRFADGSVSPPSGSTDPGASGGSPSPTGTGDSSPAPGNDAQTELDASPPSPDRRDADVVPADGRISIIQLPNPSPSGSASRITRGPDGNMWFTQNGANQIGRITPAGVITEFQVPTPSAGLGGIAAGPDGNLWFTEGAASQIGRITPLGEFQEYALPWASSMSGDIAAGLDDQLWFLDNPDYIGRISTSGASVRFPANVLGDSITGSPEGNVWFTETHDNKIASITPSGQTTTFEPFPGLLLAAGIVAGSDGNVWVTAGQLPGHDRGIGRVTPSGVAQLFSTNPYQPAVLAASPDGATLWFIETGKQVGFGRMTTAGHLTHYLESYDLSGRIVPVDIAVGLDGSLWIADWAGAIDRLAP